MLRSQRPKHLLNDIKLVHLRISREHRLAIGDFPHNASNGPNIDRKGVRSRAEEKFRRAVPSRGHIIRENISFFNNASESEVTKLEDFSFDVNEKVFWFDVSMNDSIRMAPVNGIGELVDISLDELIRESFGLFFENLEKILFDEFEDQIELSFSSKG